MRISSGELHRILPNQINDKAGPLV